jgi:hypothetical protein
VNFLQLKTIQSEISRQCYAPHSWAEEVCVPSKSPNSLDADRGMFEELKKVRGGMSFFHHVFTTTKN